MANEPRQFEKVKHTARPPEDRSKPKRFQIVRLEERIAPTKCGTNPHGKQTGFHGCGYG